MTDQQEAVHLLEKLLLGLSETFPENRKIFEAHQEWLNRIAVYPADHRMLVTHLRDLSEEVKAWSLTAHVLRQARVG